MNTIRHSHGLSLPIVLGLLATAACGGSTSSAGETPGDGGTTLGDGQAGGSDAAGEAADEAGPSIPAIPLFSCGGSLDGVAYTVGATIGSQPFQLTLDTGSTTLGVAGASCSGCSVTPKYTPGATAVDEKKTASSQYGTGSWSGEIYQDDVTLAPTASTPLKFASITSQSQFFEPIQCDSKSGSIQGIIGFAPATLAVAGTSGFLDQYVATQKVPDIFATQLCDSGGSLWLGGYDPAATTAAPQYTPFEPSALSLGYYAVTLVSIEANGTTVPVASAQYADSLVDTGTSIFALGNTAFTALAAAIGGDAAFTKMFGGASFFTGSGSGGVPCGGAGQSKAAIDAALPVLTLTFGTNPAISVKATATESYLFPNSNSWCSAMQGFDQSQAPVAGIMGAPILRSNVMIYDRAQKRLGFAPHTACP